jgi:hypothetical protein
MVTNKSAKRGGVKAFIKRHDRLLTIIGALVVFVTFIVKEERRDELKEIVAAISTAQAFHGVRDDIMLLTAEIQEPIRRIDSISNELDLAKPPNKREFDYKSVVLTGEIDHMQTINYSILRAAFNFFEELPKQPAKVRDTLDNLKSRFEALKQDRELLRSKDEQWTTEQLRKDLRTNRNAPIPRTDKFVPEMLEQFNRAKALETDIVEARDQVFRGARAEREEYEASYRITSRWSIGLFAFGWFLGLIGKLFGVRSEESAE